LASASNSADADGFGGQRGEYTDQETKLLCLTNRYYDPSNARFLNRDPIDYRGGINLAYAGNNPVTGSDPSELGWVEMAPRLEAEAQDWMQTLGFVPR
jgi:RHS repeat-associated protein